MKKIKNMVAFAIMILMFFALSSVLSAEEAYVLPTEPECKNMEGEWFLSDILSYGILRFQHGDSTVYLDYNMVSEFGFEYAKNHDRALRNVESIRYLFPQNRLGQTIYPDYFGGMYIDYNGNLIVLIADDKSISESSLWGTIKNNNITIRHVCFSYDFLRDIFYEILSFDPQQHAVFQYVQKIYIDIMENRIVVKIDGLTNEKKSTFLQQIVNSPVITFKDSFGLRIVHAICRDISFPTIIYIGNPNVIELYSSDVTPLNNRRLYPGDRIYVARPVPGQPGYYTVIGAASLGYRAEIAAGNRRGFVTVAHIWPDQFGARSGTNDQIVIPVNGQWTSIGVVARTTFLRNDAIFVELADGWYVYQRVGEQIICDRTITVVPGQAMWSIGQTTGLQGGNVLNVDVAIYIRVPETLGSDVLVTVQVVGLASSTVFRDRGDSGGMSFAGRRIVHPYGWTNPIQGIGVAISAVICPVTDEIITFYRSYHALAEVVNPLLGVRVRTP